MAHVRVLNVVYDGVYEGPSGSTIHAHGNSVAYRLQIRRFFSYVSRSGRSHTPRVDIRDLCLAEEAPTLLRYLRILIAMDFEGPIVRTEGVLRGPRLNAVHRAGSVAHGPSSARPSTPCNCDRADPRGLSTFYSSQTVWDGPHFNLTPSHTLWLSATPSEE